MTKMCAQQIVEPDGIFNNSICVTNLRCELTLNQVHFHVLQTSVSTLSG